MADKDLGDMVKDKGGRKREDESMDLHTSVA